MGNMTEVRENVNLFLLAFIEWLEIFNYVSVLNKFNYRLIIKLYFTETFSLSNVSLPQLWNPLNLVKSFIS